MLTLSEILMPNNTGTPISNTTTQTPTKDKILWTHFKKQSKSHSPKNFYNFKPFKVPLSKAEILASALKRNYYKDMKKPQKSTKLPNSPRKLSPLSTRHETEENPKNLDTSFSLKNVKKVKIPKNHVVFLHSLRNTSEKTEKINDFSEDLSMFEEHPLYSEKFKGKKLENNGRSSKNSKILHYLLSPKQQSKENLIKIYRLNKKLVETHEDDYQKNAEILTKILELLISNPELYGEVAENLPKIVLKFLFCENERILSFFHEVCNKNVKKTTYIGLIEEIMRNFGLVQQENRKIIAEKDQKIEEFRSANEKIRENLLDFEEKWKKDKEIGQKLLEEKAKCFEQTINSHLNEKNALKSRVELQKSEIDGLRREIEALTANYEEKILIINNTSEKKLQIIEKDFATFKQNHQSFSENVVQMQSNYRIALQLLAKLNKKIAVLEEKLTKAESENHKLSLRAATNFPEFTPRPDYEPLLELLKETPLNFNEKSTIEKTRILAEKLKIAINNCKNAKKSQALSRSNSRKKTRKQDSKIAFSEVRLGDYEEKHDKKTERIESLLFRKSSFKQKIMKQQTLEPYDV